jgi:hypothetical protein
VVLLAEQVASTKSSEFTIITEEFIERSSDDHVQVDVEFASGNITVEEGNLSPPSFPAFLQFLSFDVGVQSIGVISETIESHLPCGISQDASV